MICLHTVSKIYQIKSEKQKKGDDPKEIGFSPSMVAFLRL